MTYLDRVRECIGCDPTKLAVEIQSRCLAFQIVHPEVIEYLERKCSLDHLICGREESHGKQLPRPTDRILTSAPVDRYVVHTRSVHNTHHRHLLIILLLPRLVGNVSQQGNIFLGIESFPVIGTIDIHMIRLIYIQSSSRTRLSSMAEMNDDTNLVQPCRCVVVTGPLLDSVKWMSTV